MALNVLGDSHSLYSFAGVAEAKIYWRGPVTMHRAARDGIRSLIPGNCSLKPDDILILSFGEIDSRVHIPKQAMLNKRSSLEEADLLCDRFEIAIRHFRQTCRSRIAIACIIPFSPATLERRLYADDGSCVADAKAIRDRMNERLASMGLPFVDFRKAFSQDDGSIIPDLGDGNVHIDSRHSEPVIKALEKCFGTTFSWRTPPWPNPKPIAEPPYYPPLKRAGKRLEAGARKLLRRIPGFTKAKEALKGKAATGRPVHGPPSGGA